MESYYDGYNEPNYRTFYVILDSIDRSYVTNTEDRDVAEQYYEKGYLIDELRMQQMQPSRNVLVTTTVTIYW